MAKNFETLEEAKKYLRAHWGEENIECPCCHQLVSRQKRILYSSMAYVLILIYRKHREIGFNQWVDVHALMRENKINVPDYTKFRYWGILEAKIEKRPDDSNRNGKWRITQKGINFIKDASMRVPKYFWVFNNKVWGHSEKEINFQEALGKKFDYTEMMKEFKDDPTQDTLL